MSLQHCLRRTQRTGISTLFQCRTYAVPANHAVPAQQPKSQTPIPKSSCPPDTVLSGINYLKNQTPVLALPDEEYPPWLWTILRPKELEDDGPGGRKERIQRRTENKQRIRERNFMSTQ
ncbi:mitochondrial ribosomal protein L37-domain-containing protein [Lentinula aciculospora]|uniref:Large ribosomal subunit protein mL54 n=1 Tax=Lentinula aciculospora TaxID=153920 RepID=A0A9W9AEL8_9AGAR|nr:mitochondrial ribosomal protein L37-domain-containing protein [Lentinula aciculospora]